MGGAKNRIDQIVPGAGFRRHRRRRAAAPTGTPSGRPASHRSRPCPRRRDACDTVPVAGASIAWASTAPSAMAQSRGSSASALPRTSVPVQSRIFRPARSTSNAAARSALEQQQMIGKPPQTAKHDLLVLRQFLAGVERASPHPFKDGYVGQQRRTLDLCLRSGAIMICFLRRIARFYTAIGRADLINLLVRNFIKSR